MCARDACKRVCVREKGHTRDVRAWRAPVPVHKSVHVRARVRACVRACVGVRESVSACDADGGVRACVLAWRRRRRARRGPCPPPPRPAGAGSPSGSPRACPRAVQP